MLFLNLMATNISYILQQAQNHGLKQQIQYILILYTLIHHLKQKHGMVQQMKMTPTIHKHQEYIQHHYMMKVIQIICIM